MFPFRILQNKCFGDSETGTDSIDGKDSETGRDSVDWEAFQSLFQYPAPKNQGNVVYKLLFNSPALNTTLTNVQEGFFLSQK